MGFIVTIRILLQFSNLVANCTRFSELFLITNHFLFVWSDTLVEKVRPNDFLFTGSVLLSFVKGRVILFDDERNDIELFFGVSFRDVKFNPLRDAEAYFACCCLLFV